MHTLPTHSFYSLKRRGGKSMDKSSFKLICVGLSDTQSCSIRPSCWGPGKQWVVMIMNVVLFLLVKNQSLCQYMWCCMQDSCVWRIYQGIAHIIRNITILLGTLSSNNIYIYVDDFKVQQSKTLKLMVHLKANAEQNVADWLKIVPSSRKVLSFKTFQDYQAQLSH